jgi:putative Holliday junction resolvase
MNGRILAVDPGEKRIGIAISDPSGTIARPFKVLEHVSRILDAAQITQFAADQGAVRIIIGQALDDEGRVGPSGRKAHRLAEAVQAQTDIPVELWDESGSTGEAQAVRLQMGAKRSQRTGHLDDLAAAIILQSYLDAHRHIEEA